MQGSKRVLVLTNAADATSDYLCSRLADGEVPYVRFNTDVDCETARLVYNEGGHNLSWKGQHLSPTQVSAVVLRRPKPIGLGSAADEQSKGHASLEWSEGLEGFLAHIETVKWINHPSRNCMASHKIEQLTRAKRYNLSVPSTTVTNSQDVAKGFVESQKNGVVVKPMSSGYIERESGDSIIYTREFHKTNLIHLESLGTCPVMFQEKIRKRTDVRVTVLDEAMIAIEMNRIESSGEQVLDIRRDNMRNIQYGRIEIPDSIRTNLRALLVSYGLRFAAVDFGISKTGEWVFFEINPNGQWAWLDLEADAGISELFVQSFRECIYA